MARNLLSDQKIKSLVAKAHADSFHRDGDGLFLRVRPSSEGNAAGWIFRYTFLGKRKRITLGAWPVMALKQARERRDQAIALLAEHKDPALMLSRHAASPAALTLSAGRDLWAIHGNIRRRKDAGKALLSVVDTLIGQVGDIPLTAFTTSHLLAGTEHLRQRGTLAAVTIHLSTIKRFFTFLVSHDYLSRNPVARANVDFVGGAYPRARERALSFQEIIALGQSLRHRHMGQAYLTHLIPVLLATGVRQNELIGTPKKEILETPWIIPAERLKTRNAAPPDHWVYLSGFARRHIERMIKLAPSSEWLVPLQTNPFRPMNTDALQNWFRYRPEDKGIDAIPAWKLHDLRRTMATRMGDVGIPPHIIELCLGHAAAGSNKVQRTYQRQQYLPERKLAMETWGYIMESLWERHEIPPVVQQFIAGDMLRWPDWYLQARQPSPPQQNDAPPLKPGPREKPRLRVV